MRLWHQAMIPLLPYPQLIGQHRECCALRGKGWGKKHSVVDYVFTHSPRKLYDYHTLIMQRLETEYHVTLDQKWKIPEYRGKKCEAYKNLTCSTSSGNIYHEHDGNYLHECIENLRGKGHDVSIFLRILQRK